jgi:hypothetical protein
MAISATQHSLINAVGVRWHAIAVNKEEAVPARAAGADQLHVANSKQQRQHN